MRARLLHPLRERSHERPSRRGHSRRSAARPLEPTAPASPVETPEAHAANGCCDPDAQRVRDAGGPLDEAVYSCGCGFLFSASVSTTVVCPHCGGGQAW